MGLVIAQTLVFEAVFQDFVSAQDIRDWLAGIDRAIRHGRAFYFIATTRAQARFAEDYRAIQAHWYKANREHFRTHCLGLVRIAGDEAERARLDTPALHAAWGVPYFVALSRAQGLQWVSQRMVQA